MTTLILPLPPSVNNAYANTRRGRVLTREGRAYKQRARQVAAMQETTCHRGDVAVRMTVYLPDRRRDLDNCAKLCLDALKCICYDDDRQVGYLEMIRAFDKGNPRVELTVAPLSAQEVAA